MFKSDLLSLLSSEYKFGCKCGTWNRVEQQIVLYEVQG